MWLDHLTILMFWVCPSYHLSKRYDLIVNDVCVHDQETSTNDWPQWTSCAHVFLPWTLLFICNTTRALMFPLNIGIAWHETIMNIWDIIIINTHYYLPLEHYLQQSPTCTRVKIIHLHLFLIIASYTYVLMIMLAFGKGCLLAGIVRFVCSLQILQCHLIWHCFIIFGF
jgi:hypothetical protein